MPRDARVSALVSCISANQDAKLNSPDLLSLQIHTLWKCAGLRSERRTLYKLGLNYSVSFSDLNPLPSLRDGAQRDIPVN